MSNEEDEFDDTDDDSLLQAAAAFQVSNPLYTDTRHILVISR